MVRELSELMGKVLSSVQQVGNDKIIFETTEGKKYSMYHRQDCCESVTIEDIAGDLQSLLGHPILLAEERTQNDEKASESGSWTFYEISTIHGNVTIRWYGSSNGYYSERVDFQEVI